jgi:catechol-2,3-dioxygenase
MIGTDKILGTKDAMATLAVKDLEVARKFYEETLGLTPTENWTSGVLAFQTGHSVILVYTSTYAGTNRATAATWVVGEEIASLVDALKARGVRFEHYDLPGMERRGDLHVSGRIQAAWFKDPDGNILSLVNG